MDHSAPDKSPDTRLPRRRRWLCRSVRPSTLGHRRNAAPHPHPHPPCWRQCPLSRSTVIRRHRAQRRHVVHPMRRADLLPRQRPLRKHSLWSARVDHLVSAGSCTRQPADSRTVPASKKPQFAGVRTLRADNTKPAGKPRRFSSEEIARRLAANLVAHLTQLTGRRRCRHQLQARQAPVAWSWRRNSPRARCKRLITVPIGQPNSAAASR